MPTDGPTRADKLRLVVLLTALLGLIAAASSLSVWLWLAVVLYVSVVLDLYRSRVPD